jgi:hypothetical protein
MYCISKYFYINSEKKCTHASYLLHIMNSGHNFRTKSILNTVYDKEELLRIARRIAVRET